MDSFFDKFETKTVFLVFGPAPTTLNLCCYGSYDEAKDAYLRAAVIPNGVVVPGTEIVDRREDDVKENFTMGLQ